MESIESIKEYIKKYNDIDELREKLGNIGIMMKLYSEYNLALIYTRFEDNNNYNKKNELKNECRSLIIDTVDKNIVSYSCNTPIRNIEAMNFLLENNNNEMKIHKCYEGTLLSVFCHNNIWHVSTRRCLDSKTSIWKEHSYYDLLIDVLNRSNYETLDDFTKILDSNYCYYFILIHHLNKNIVDYTSSFGENYGKLCLAIVRNKDDLKEVTFSKLSEVLNTNNFSNIFIPEEYKSLTDINYMNDKTNKNLLNCIDEGYVLKIKNNNDYYKYLKIQNHSYQFNIAIGSDKNIFKGFIVLYQNSKLEHYLNNNKNLNNFKKIINPLNINESYDTVGMVDAVFKVITSEIYELFKMLWDLRTCKHLNYDLYESVPKEYKKILYHVKGIYYKNKSRYYNSGNKQNKNFLYIKDIYQYFKLIDTETIEDILRIRKLMSNLTRIKQGEKVYKLFTNISSKCDKVHLKLTAIFTNKLFPHIMPDDIPAEFICS